MLDQPLLWKKKSCSLLTYGSRAKLKEQLHKHTHTPEIIFFIGATTNIKHFCKSSLLASLTCFVWVSDKREEQQREDQRECGVDYHSTAPQRDTRGGCWIKNVSEAVRTKRGRDWGGGGRKGEKCGTLISLDMWDLSFLWASWIWWRRSHQPTVQVLECRTASCLCNVMISPTSLCRCVHLHLPLHSRCPSRQPVSCGFECLSSGDLILSLCRGWPLKDKMLSNHLCASFLLLFVSCGLLFCGNYNQMSFAPPLLFSLENENSDTPCSLFALLKTEIRWGFSDGWPLTCTHLSDETYGKLHLLIIEH